MYRRSPQYLKIYHAFALAILATLAPVVACSARLASRCRWLATMESIIGATAIPIATSVACASGTTAGTTAKDGASRLAEWHTDYSPMSQVARAAMRET